MVADGPEPKPDLALTATDDAGGLSLAFESGRGLFTSATIERLLGSLETLLEGIIADPGRRIGFLPVLPALQARQEGTVTKSEGYGRGKIAFGGT